MQTGGKKTYRKKNIVSCYKSAIAFILILALCSLGIMTVFAEEEDMVEEPSEVQEKIIEEVEQEQEEPEEPEEPEESEESEEETEETPLIMSIAEPMILSLEAPDLDIAPEHHKYIRYNGGDSYTLNLDVKGLYDSSNEKRKVDVVLIIDRSASMEKNMNNGKSRLRVIKDIVDGKNGMAESILDNSNIDGKMAVVIYSGNAGNRDAAWNDAWITKQWTNSKVEIVNAVEEIRADGGTNCQAGLRTAKELLSSARTDAEKYVVFLSDGEPTYCYNSSGKTMGNGRNDSDGTNAQAAYDEAATISGLTGFYGVGIVSDNSATQKNFLTTLSTIADSQKRGVYFNNSSEELIRTFQNITAQITEFTCRGVTISDTLSAYAQIEPSWNEAYQIIVTDENGTAIEQLQYNGKTVTPKELITVSYVDESDTINAVFPEDYILDKNYTYTLQFPVKPSQMAYDVFLAGGYLDIGSEGSDAPGNNTSSGKDGFYTNEGAVLQYIYGEENAEVKSTGYVEQPVLQIQTGTLIVNKEVSGAMGDKTKLFTIQIELLKNDGTPFTGELAVIGEIKDGIEHVSAPMSEMVMFQDGKAEISLSHGQQIRMNDLPIGMSYVINEKTPEDYEALYDEKKLEKMEGSIAGETVIAIVNNKEYVPPTGLYNLAMKKNMTLLILLIGITGFAGIIAKTTVQKRKIYR